MPKVLISDSLDNIASEILIKNNISVDTKTNLSPEELKKIFKELNISEDPKKFKRYGSARNLYNFKIDNLSAY